MRPYISSPGVRYVVLGFLFLLSAQRFLPKPPLVVMVMVILSALVRSHQSTSLAPAQAENPPLATSPATGAQTCLSVAATVAEPGRRSPRRWRHCRGGRQSLAQVAGAGRWCRVAGAGRWRRSLAVWHPQAKTKCPRLEFSNEMQMDFVLSQV